MSVTTSTRCGGPSLTASQSRQIRRSSLCRSVRPRVWATPPREPALGASCHLVPPFRETPDPARRCAQVVASAGDGSSPAFPRKRRGAGQAPPTSTSPSAAGSRQQARSRPSFAAPALSHGGGGGGGVDGVTKGYGGGDGDGDAGGGGLGVPGQLVHAVAEGWRKRVQVDPDFAFKLAVECLNDALIVLAVNAANRGSRFFKEIEFVICHIAVSLLNDVSLVWLLAPLPAAAAKSGFLSSLPQHCFQAGSFSLQQRLGCLAYKAGLYGVIGFAMGMAGTALVHGLTAVREKVDPEFKPPAEYQPIVKSGLVWALYMGTSSNLRYQTVNGLERLLYSTLPSNAAKLLTVGMRLGNNFLGSMIFVWLAKVSHLNQPRPSAKVLVAAAQ